MYIKQVFEDECPDIRVDNSFFKKIIQIETSFVNKNTEHVEFFGGTLLGVQVVRFTPDDRDRLFNELLKIDEIYLEDALYSAKTPNGQLVINREYKISSDVFNLSCVWILHEIHKSRYLSDKDKQEAKIRLCMYMLYRFMTSLLYNLFRYPADKATAQATYDVLSYKYILKQQGSWGNTIRYIATNAVSDKGIHSKVISDMNDDTGVVNMLNDIQGRIRDMLKNIYSEFMRIHEQGIKVSSTSALIETDGDVVLKDKQKSLMNYTRYIKSITPDKNSFIKQELIDVVCNMMHTMPEKLLVQSLEWMSTNYGHLKDNLIDDTIDAIMHNAFDYLSEHKNLIHNKANIQDLIAKLRGSYMSSRSNEPSMVKARDLTKKIIISATKTKNDSVIAATRTGVMIYIVLRSLTMRYYTNK
jgi:hypothetical protein